MLVNNNMKLNWNKNFHRLTDAEKSRGEETTPYPDEDGVYVIAEDVDGEQIARYVGKGNIRIRLSAHKQDSEPNPDLKSLMQDRTYQYRIHYALISNDTDMSNAEFTLFTHYGGLPNLYNDTTPEGELDSTAEPPF